MGLSSGRSRVLPETAVRRVRWSRYGGHGKVNRGGIRISAAAFLVLFLLCINAAGASAAEECAVSVAPKVGPAGTVFTIGGSGFTPTMLTLEKGGSTAGSHTLELQPGESWEFPIRSRPGDEGEWTAVVTSDACTATAEFRVTLHNTDAAGDLAARNLADGVPSRAVPLAAILLVIAAGASGGLVLGRRLQPATRDNRPL